MLMPALINSSAVQLIGQLQLQRAKLGAPNVMCVCDHRHLVLLR